MFVYRSFVPIKSHFNLVYFFSGKILDDEKAIKDYKIEEKNFVVVMVTKVSSL